jgi:hypothetical protein
VTSEERALDLAALRELALFTLVGAQISASDALWLTSSLSGDCGERRGSLWVDLAAVVAFVATFAYLALSGG